MIWKDSTRVSWRWSQDDRHDHVPSIRFASERPAVSSPQYYHNSQHCQLTTFYQNTLNSYCESIMAHDHSHHIATRSTKDLPYLLTTFHHQAPSPSSHFTIVSKPDFQLTSQIQQTNTTQHHGPTQRPQRHRATSHLHVLTPRYAACHSVLRASNHRHPDDTLHTHGLSILHLRHSPRDLQSRYRC